MGMMDQNPRQSKLRTAQENRRKAKHDNVSFSDSLTFFNSFDDKDLRTPLWGKSDI
jgi:hypothetical protein